LSRGARERSVEAMALGRDEAAFSLVELLVVLAVLGLVMAGALGLLDSGLGAYALGAARTEAQQAARVGLERMAKELRQAGYDPAGAAPPAIVVAEPTRLVFQMDLNGNGVIDPTRERITYLLRADGVLRRDAGAGAQPIVEGVRRLEFAYFDRAGAPTADPARVRAIRIRIQTGASWAGVLPRMSPGVLMETEVALRNDVP
jgi:prepilin-type N-terminal cleavage/methylation domain-containing protein